MPLTHRILLPQLGQYLQLPVFSGVVSHWPRLRIPTPFHSLLASIVLGAASTGGALSLLSTRPTPFLHHPALMGALSPCTAHGLWDHARLPVNICREKSVKLYLGKCLQNQHVDQSTWKKLSRKNPQAQGMLDAKLAWHQQEDADTLHQCPSQPQPHHLGSLGHQKSQ